jgi:hypothetical protein
MGRSFESVRLGVKNTADRWMRVRRAMRQSDQVYAQKIAEMAKKHSSEGFYAFDDPLEAAVFSVLVELLKEMETSCTGQHCRENAEVAVESPIKSSTKTLFGE